MYFVIGRSVLSLTLFVLLSFNFELDINSAIQRCANKTKSKNFTTKGFHHTIDDCTHKITLVISIKNNEKSPEEVKFVYVKDVIDSESGIKLRLLNPVVVRFRQDQVLLAYPLKYLTAVNGRATEHIISYENQKNFTGCDDESPINPTCGIQHVKGVSLEYSQGFCCFCPTAPTKGNQARGGQDCSLEKPPTPDIDLTAYKASAHCLKKSDIWYTVNDVESPEIIHQVYIQIYSQQHLHNGSVVWVALTGEEDFALGPRNPYQFDDEKSIVITHLTEKPDSASVTIATENNRLLIPQPLIGTDEKDWPPAVKNGANDYLIISKDVLNSDGSECDKGGVSYEGFSLQRDRCDVPRNTCLKNQPLEFWEKDTEKVASGQKGTYLLKNFGVPYKDPIAIDKETQEHWLALEYYKPHRTTVHVEARANNIIAVKVGKHAMIVYIISESTTKSINFYVAIQNAGLVSAEFSVQAVRCDLSVPDSAVVTKVIPPQLKTDFVISTKPGNVQINEKYECIVEAKSAAYGVIAKRKATVNPKSRCICNFHCSCECLGDSLKCDPLSEKDYHLAGFRGSLPVLTAKPPHKLWFIKYPLAAFIVFILCLLFIGFIKAAFGIAGVDSIGECGLLSRLYKPGDIVAYKAPEFRTHEVQYDDEHYPLHPDFGTRYKMYSASYLFCLNCCFCFYWPCSQLFRMMNPKTGYQDITSQESGESADNEDNDEEQGEDNNEGQGKDNYEEKGESRKWSQKKESSSEKPVATLEVDKSESVHYRGSTPAIIHRRDQVLQEDSKTSGV